MKDTGKHAWWEHGKTPGHKALEGNLVNSFSTLQWLWGPGRARRHNVRLSPFAAGCLQNECVCSRWWGARACNCRCRCIGRSRLSIGSGLRDPLCSDRDTWIIHTHIAVSCCVPVDHRCAAAVDTTCCCNVWLLWALSRQGMDLASAPGWGSLLPHSKHGVDTGLQCPMCINQRKFFA